MKVSIGLYRIYDQTYVNNYIVRDSKSVNVSRILINTELIRGRRDYTLLIQTTFYLNLLQCYGINFT
jgi:hypothetical protein